MYSFYKIIYTLLYTYLIHNLEFVCTSHSNLQYAWLTQAVVIYEVFSGL